MDKFKKYGPMGIVMMIFLFAAFIFLAGLAVMVLWNWLVPELFNGPEVSYWQALGLLVLSKLLFGFGGGKGHKGGHKGKHMKSEWMHRWKNMDPEVRKEFLRRKCGTDWYSKKEEGETNPPPSSNPKTEE